MLYVRYVIKSKQVSVCVLCGVCMWVVSASICVLGLQSAAHKVWSIRVFVCVHVCVCMCVCVWERECESVWESESESERERERENMEENGGWGESTRQELTKSILVRCMSRTLSVALRTHCLLHYKHTLSIALHTHIVYCTTHTLSVALLTQYIEQGCWQYTGYEQYMWALFKCTSQCVWMASTYLPVLGPVAPGGHGQLPDETQQQQPTTAGVRASYCILLVWYWCTDMGILILVYWY
jgi:hypothetical protein